jgi:V/A-type H+-transporting ATPase subunit E
MGQIELKTALQCQTAEQVRQVWAEAEQTVAGRRAEVEEQMAKRQQLAEQRQAKSDCRLREEHLLKVRQQNQHSRLTVEAQLNRRLRQLAERLLPELVTGNREALWSRLTTQIPDADWATVRVHPDDRTRAVDHFTGATIETDPALVAGLVAINRDGRVRVDNSLSRRLERAWPALLPPLMTRLKTMVETDATVETETGI